MQASAGMRQTLPLSPAAAQDFFDAKIAAGGDAYLEYYWSTQHQAHRRALVGVCHTLPGIKSVLEVGVMAGTNLKLLRDAFPWLQLCGSDVNPQAVAFAARKLSGAELRVGAPLDFLRAQRDRAVDVVFSCYTLAYLDRDAVVPVLIEALRVARRAIICAEPHILNGTQVLRTEPLPEWAHDYGNILNSHVAESKSRTGRTESVGLEPAVDHCNMITVVRFTD